LLNYKNHNLFFASSGTPLLKRGAIYGANNSVFIILE